jgi:hypothetical protein
MRNLKLIIGLLLFSAVTCSAQNKLQIGAGVGFGTKIDRPGIQIGAVYHFSDYWAGEADIFYFFPHKYTLAKNTFWALNVNAHYLFLSRNTNTVYALAGLNIATLGLDVPEAPQYVHIRSSSASATKAGLNLGAGGSIGIGFGSIFGEAKYIFSRYDQFVISLGVRIDL